MVKEMHIDLNHIFHGNEVAQLFADNAGQSLSADAIRAAFDDAFGAGTGARVGVSCQGRGDNRKITELTLSLAGDVKGTAGLGDLMRAAQAIAPGCPSGFPSSPPRTRRTCLPTWGTGTSASCGGASRPTRGPYG